MNDFAYRILRVPMLIITTTIADNVPFQVFLLFKLFIIYIQITGMTHAITEHRYPGNPIYFLHKNNRWRQRWSHRIHTVFGIEWNYYAKVCKWPNVEWAHNPIRHRFIKPRILNCNTFWARSVIKIDDDKRMSKFRFEVKQCKIQKY